MKRGYLFLALLKEAYPILVFTVTLTIFVLVLFLTVAFHSEYSEYDYMVGFMDGRGGENRSFMLYIINTAADDVIFSVTSMSETFKNATTLRCGECETVFIPNDHFAQGSRKGSHGIRVASNKSLLVYGVRRSIAGSSMDGFLGIPRMRLGHLYYSVCVMGEDDEKSEFLVIGVFYDTSVHIEIKCNTSVTYAGVDYVNGDAITESIGEYDTVQVQGQGCDLTGTRIWSSRRVSVFSGNNHVRVERKGHLVEQLPPVNVWGKHYMTFPPGNQFQYDYKIVAGYSNTKVNVTCSDINFWSFELQEPGDFRSDSLGQLVCVFISNEPTLMTMITYSYDQDPSFTVIPPLQEIEGNFLFYVPEVVNTSAHLMLVTKSNPALLILDTTALTPSILSIADDLAGGFVSLHAGVHNINLSGSAFPISISGFIHGTGSDGKETLSFPLLWTYVSKLYVVIRIFYFSIFVKVS